MRRFTILLACLLITSFAWTQNSTADFKYGIKLGNQSTWNYSRIRDANGNTISGGTVQLFRLQPGFLLKGSKGNFWDFSLQNINGLIGSRSNPRLNGTRLYNLGLNLKAGYFFAFLKQKTTHWAPMLGLEWNPSVGFSRLAYSKVIQGVLTSTGYTRSVSRFGSQLLLAPRVMWCPGKRFFMDATLNIPLIDLTLAHYTISDPAATVPSRYLTNLRFPNNNVQFTLGFGLKL